MASLPNARTIAGGTDLMLESTQRYETFDALIDVTQIPSLSEIRSKAGELQIGSAVDYAQMATFFAEKHPQLHSFFERIASRQIRNRGTIGGNIANASPIADLPPILLAFDAIVTLVDSSGGTRNIPISDFYHGYKITELKKGEYISHFSFAERFLLDDCQFFKVSKRIEDDISSVMLATRFRAEANQIVEARIAFGGMAATPIRVYDAENCLLHMSVNDQSAIDSAIKHIRNDLKPIGDVRASHAYRLDIACNLLKKSWMNLNMETIPLVTESSGRYERQAIQNA